MAFTMEAPRAYNSFQERWDWIIAFMVLEDMFVHEVLMMMEKRPNKAVGTMGVAVDNSNLILYYNPEFVNALSDPELRYVVTHEIYHVVLHHVTIRMPEDPRDRKIYNIAHDLAINSLIPETAARHMPKAPELRGALPKDYGFEEKLSGEQYVQLLKEKAEGGGKGDGNSGGGGGGGGQKDSEDGKGFDNHDMWDESEIVDEMVRNKVEQLSKDERAWGNIPGDIQAMILAAQRSQVNWTKYLRQYLGNLVSSRSESTFKRPNRRFGYPYSGTKRLHVDRKLVAIDTSGSISDDDLKQFLAEINKLAEIQPVDLQLFDHSLQGPIRPFEKRHTAYKFSGRGGTCFTPVFELAENRRYQSLIVLTDGCAEEPPKPQRVKDVLWVITGNGKPPVDWGKQVKITPKVE